MSKILFQPMGLPPFTMTTQLAPGSRLLILHQPARMITRKRRSFKEKSTTTGILALISILLWPLRKKEDMNVLRRMCAATSACHDFGRLNALPHGEDTGTNPVVREYA